MSENQRSTKFDLIAPAETRQAVINSIRRYRAGCREMYGVLMASQAAGAEIVERDDRLSLKPSTTRAAAVLALMMDRASVEKAKGKRGEGTTFTVSGSGAATAYDMRNWFLMHLFPTAKSFVWDSARRDITSVWASADPEHPKAGRGWLALQGSRGVAQFQRRGIGCPVATAKPELKKRSLTLEWDTALGRLEFPLAKTDGGRWQIWDKLRDGEPGWELGTVFITERDGKIEVLLSHQRPSIDAEVDVDRVCEAQIEPASQETFLRIGCGDDFEMVVGDSVKALLTRLLKSRTVMEARRASCGAKSRSWGHRNAWVAEQGVLSRLTAKRDGLVQDYNHAWTRRIVSWAVKSRCGKIRCKVPADSMLFGQPWQWSQFRAFLEYKATERGIVVEQS